MVEELLRTKPSAAWDIEGVVAGIYEAEMELINEETGGQHTFDELTEYPHPGGTVFGLSYDEHTYYRKRTWVERMHLIPKYADEAELIATAQVCDPSWVTAAGDGVVLQQIPKWLSLNYPNMSIPIVTVPKGSDKSDLDFNVFVDDAPRLAYRVAALHKEMERLRTEKAHIVQVTPKKLVTPRWPYTPRDLHEHAPSHIIGVAADPTEAFRMSRGMFVGATPTPARAPLAAKSY